MLKQRILTALILIPLFLAALFFLPANYFMWFIGVITVIGASEWSGLMGITQFPHFLIYPLIILCAIIGSVFLPAKYILGLSCLFWLSALYLVVRYPALSSVWGKGFFWRGLMGILVLVPCFSAINLIRNMPHGPFILLFLFILIWGADSGAYFVGKKWGKTKLIPAVSPGKSWQGFFGALITTAIIACIGLFIFKIPSHDSVWFLAASLITVLFSILGDLFESMLKRNAGVKDSGRLLPGHGGILDRIDSLTAAAPVFGFFLILWA